MFSRAIATYAQQDFGAPVSDVAEAENRRWANESFDQMLAEGPGGVFVGAWELQRPAAALAESAGDGQLRSAIIENDEAEA